MRDEMNRCLEKLQKYSVPRNCKIKQNRNSIIEKVTYHKEQSVTILYYSLYSRNQLR